MKVSFWSNTEYSGFLAGLIRELNESGLEAQQCYQISEASYRSAKSTPARLWLRFRQYIAYPIQICASLVLSRIREARRCKSGRVKRCAHAIGSDEATQQLNDSTYNSVAVVSTNTFYAPLLATYLHPNVVHLVYDLFPEAMLHSGKWQEGTLKVKLVRWITKKTLQRTKCNVFLGERLKAYVESIHGPVSNAAIIAVGADQSLFPASPKQRLIREDEGTRTVAEKPSHIPTFPPSNSAPLILYCGNFGNMHDSATLFQFLDKIAGGTKISEDGVQKTEASECRRHASASRNTSDLCSPVSDLCSKMTWSFCCSGPKRSSLETVISELPDVLKNQIQLGGGLGQDAWIQTMESADVALVTMTPGSETVVMPSKTYSAMMAGQAILAIAPEDSDLVDTIKAADCGWWVEPGDVEGLAAVVNTICSDADSLMEKRENAFRYAHQHFGQDALAKQWLDVVEQV